MEMNKEAVQQTIENISTLADGREIPEELDNLKYLEHDTKRVEILETLWKGISDTAAPDEKIANNAYRIELRFRLGEKGLLFTHRAEVNSEKIPFQITGSTKGDTEIVVEPLSPKKEDPIAMEEETTINPGSPEEHVSMAGTAAKVVKQHQPAKEQEFKSETDSPETTKLLIVEAKPTEEAKQPTK